MGSTAYLLLPHGNHVHQAEQRGEESSVTNVKVT
jgi:hypothetical protein